MKLPGLIDPHVHLRDPGQTEKEDFHTGTMAALAGGFTTLIDMPNNRTPITTYERLLEKQKRAQPMIVCDTGFHFGTLGENVAEFPKIQQYVLGLKVYLNQTTGNYIVDASVFKKICQAWPRQKPILVHAEEDVLEEIIAIANEYKQRLHVCHISSAKELQIIMNAKKKGYTITCGVTAHHLFLTDKDTEKIGSFAKMKPYLKSQEDVDFLWKNFKHIDIIESDHAPHTLEEKQAANPPFGVPGLETTLPLLLTEMNKGKITKEDIIDKCYTRAKEIFKIPDQPDTYVEVDDNEAWTIENGKLYTKCNWSPFAGWKVTGKVKKVVLRGKTVFEDGKILAESGFGEIIRE